MFSAKESIPSIRNAQKMQIQQQMLHFLWECSVFSKEKHCFNKECSKCKFGRKCSIPAGNAVFPAKQSIVSISHALLSIGNALHPVRNGFRKCSTSGRKYRTSVRPTSDRKCKLACRILVACICLMHACIFARSTLRYICRKILM